MFKVNLSGYKTSVFFDQNGAFIDKIRDISNGQNIMSYFVPKLFKTKDNRSLRF